MKLKRMIPLLMLLFAVPWVCATTAKDYYDAGLQLYSSKDYKKAVQYFDAALQSDPSDSAAFLGRANCYYAQGMNEKALQDYRKVQTLRPQDAQLGKIIEALQAKAGGNPGGVSSDNTSHRLGTIVTIAGTGKAGGAGNGGDAKAAQLNQPSGLAFDPAGDLYVADTVNDCVRKIDAKGTITRLAGAGLKGFSGDGGPAASARLSQPGGLASDANGNIYIADVNNKRIRKVDIKGRITTVAGCGLKGFSGDGGPATDAKLDFPSGVACDTAGNLYIADTFNERVRKVDPNGTITTVAGSGPSVLGTWKWKRLPRNRMQKVDIRPPKPDMGDGGPATSAYLYGPMGVACDASGNLYIADDDNHRIRKVDTNGIIHTIAGGMGRGSSGDGGPATSAKIDSPGSVAVDNTGVVYFSEGKMRVRRVGTDGVITTVAGCGDYGYSGDGGPAISAKLSAVAGVQTDPVGNLYISDSINHRVRKVFLH